MSRRSILAQALEDIASDPLIIDKAAARQNAETNILSNSEDIHFAQVYMWIHSDSSLCRMWLQDYSRICTPLEDKNERKDRVIKAATETVLTDDRLTTRGRFMLLCAFGTSSGFAKKSDSFEVSGRRWRDWIVDRVERLLPNEEAEEEWFALREEDEDIMDSEGWESDD